MFHKNFYWFSSLNNDLTNNYQSKTYETNTLTDELSDWVLSKLPLILANSIQDITYANGKFVAVGGYTLPSGTRTTNLIYYSTDGINWTYASGDFNTSSGLSGRPCYLYGVTYGNGKFIAVGTSAVNSSSYLGIFSSEDGITWETVLDTNMMYQLNDVTYGNGKFVAIGNSAAFSIYSTDGTTWTNGNHDGTMAAACRGVTYGNGKFIAVGNAIYYSTDGIFWSRAYADLNGYINDVTYGNGKFVAVGDKDSLNYSEDGINWGVGTEGAGPGGMNFNAVSYCNNIFIAVGDSGYIWKSSDGINWSYVGYYGSENLNGIVCANNRCVVVGGNSTVYYADYLKETKNLADTINELVTTIGSTDISAIGADVKAAISSLNTALANTQTALDNKVTTGTSAKLNTLALAGSKIALVYSEDDNVNFRYKNASGNTSYLNLRNIESKFDTLTSTLTSRGGYTCLAGLYSSTDEATTSIACSTISNYRYLVLVLKYADLRVDVKTIPRAFFVNEITSSRLAILLKSGNSEGAALVWWHGGNINAFINTAYNVVDVYGIL